MQEDSTSSKTLKGYKKIVCPTRGGEASRRTEDKAIALAHEYGAEIVFLYVVDVSFAHGHSGKFPIDVVAHEVREIGEIILEQARQRARAVGVEARSEIREGNVVEEIQRVIETHRTVDLLVVGHMSDDLRAHLAPVLAHLQERRVDVVVVYKEIDG